MIARSRELIQTFPECHDSCEDQGDYFSGARYGTVRRRSFRRLVAGQGIRHVCQALEMSEATCHRWRNQYGGMKAQEAKRLKELEVENARLKRLVADLMLDKEMLKELASGNF